MIRAARLVFVTALSLLMEDRSVAAAEPPLLSLYTEETPPLSMTVDGAVGGIGTDLLRAALAKLGLRYNIQVLPRLRAYDMALTHDQGCVYPMNRTEQREPKFRWVGPLASGGWALFAREDSDIAVKNFDDARNYRVGSTGGEAISDFLKEKGLTPEEVNAENADILNLKKLASNRIDLWASGFVRAPYVAAQQHVKLRMALRLSEASVFLACNPNVPAAMIADLAHEIGLMQADGRAEAIARRYR